MGRVDTVLTALRAGLVAEEQALARRRSVLRIFEDACRELGKLSMPVDLQAIESGALVLKVQVEPQLIEDEPDDWRPVFEDVLPTVQATFDALAQTIGSGIDPADLQLSSAPPVEAAAGPVAGGGEATPGDSCAEPVRVAAVAEPVAEHGPPAAAIKPESIFPPETGHFALWTEAEDLRVIEMSLTSSSRQIAAATGRTQSSIENRFWRWRVGKMPLPAGWCLTPDRKFARVAVPPVTEITPTGSLPPVAGEGPGGDLLPAAQPDPDAVWDKDPRAAVPVAVAAQVAEPVASGPDARFATAPQDDLTSHLLGLRRDAVWTWDHDRELAEYLGLGWNWAQIADEMQRKPAEIQARFDKLTAVNRETRVRRFVRSEMVARMALLSGLAAVEDAA